MYKYIISTTTRIAAGDFNINLVNVQANNSVSKFVDFLYTYYIFPTFLLPLVFLRCATRIENIFTNILNLIKSGLSMTNLPEHLPIF